MTKQKAIPGGIELGIDKSTMKVLQVINKQEEIARWINKYLTKRFISSDFPDNECLSEAKAILKYLDSQNVVIRVGGRLPGCGHISLSAAHGVTNPVCPLLKAGCGFFEPLIKE